MTRWSGSRASVGRLKELGKEHLAVRAHGYLLIDQEHERELTGSYTNSEAVEWDRCYTNPPDTPLHAIVKDFIDAEVHISPQLAPQMLRDFHKIHRCDILVRDCRAPNYLDGKLVDFSKSWTVPHIMLDMRIRGTQKAIDDELADVETSFDVMVERWDEDHGFGEQIISFAHPSLEYLWRLRPRGYEGRLRHKKELFRPRISVLDFEKTRLKLARLRMRSLRPRSRDASSSASDDSRR